MFIDLGIVTIAYNDYGKFLPQWCESIANLTIPPSAVTVADGVNSGISTQVKGICEGILPEIQFVEANLSTMGALRNAAITATPTQWIQYLSVDDIILPHAIEEYQEYELDADVIAIRWLSRDTWNPVRPDVFHIPVLPEAMALGDRGFIIGHSPFRRRFWKKRKYVTHDFPNYPFVADLVEQGARFVETEEACTVYLRRRDSHCGKVLGRRIIDGKKTQVHSEKKKAAKLKREMYRRIENYYDGRGISSQVRRQERRAEALSKDSQEPSA